MPSANPMYDCLEDSVIAALESGCRVPEVITLDAEDMKWLMALGLNRADGTRLPVTTTRISLCLANRWIAVRSEFDPESWMTH